MLVTLAAVWPPRRSLSKTQQPLLTPSSPERELGCGHTSSSGCGCYSHSPRNLVRPWGVGGSPHLQKAGHGADVVGACSLPHIVHPLACLQHNTSSVTHQPPQSHCSPWGPSRGKTATLKQRIKRAPHLHWVGAGNFLVLPRGPVLSEPSPGPLLPEDHYSEGDRGKGVLQLHSILSECFWAGGGGGGWDSALARPHCPSGHKDFTHSSVHSPPPSCPEGKSSSVPITEGKGGKKERQFFWVTPRWELRAPQFYVPS